MKFFVVVLSSLILVACGGGGSDAPASSTFGSSPSDSPTAGSPPLSLANEALSKYEGVWREDCDPLFHMRLTKTSTATSGTTFSVVTKEEYFEKADCTGALVATGSYGRADEDVQYSPTLAGASVTLPTETIVSNVDPATSVLAVAPFIFTGSGVTSTYIGDTMVATIKYADGTSVPIVRPKINGQTTHGAFLLRNDELLALVPIGDSTTSFKVNHRYIR